MPEFDSDEWRMLRDAKLLEWCRGNEAAASFCLGLGEVIETWDDLIDGDVVPSAEQLNRVFCTALLSLPSNPFYQANLGALLPTLTLAINAWLDANEFERVGDPHEREWAFFLRNLGMDIFIQVALICGGMEHMRAVSIEIRRFFSHETYSEWEHRHELQA